MPDDPRPGAHESPARRRSRSHSRRSRQLGSSTGASLVSNRVAQLTQPSAAAWDRQVPELLIIRGKGNAKKKRKQGAAKPPKVAAKPEFAALGPSTCASSARRAHAQSALLTLRWLCCAPPQQHSDTPRRSTVLGKLQIFLPELAAANAALDESGADGGGFELEQLPDADEVLTTDADAALKVADITEAARQASDAAVAADTGAADAAGDAAEADAEADGAEVAPQIHMDLYCGVLEEKKEEEAEDTRGVAGGVLKLPGGGVLVPREEESDDEVTITTTSTLSDSSDSDDDEAACAASGGRKVLVQEIPALSSGGMIPGLPDPTDRDLVAGGVSHDDRDVMQHVEEAVRWQRGQDGPGSNCKCVEILKIGGSNGAFTLELAMSAAVVSGEEERREIAVKTRRTVEGELAVVPLKG